tara:strand:+ start:195 stop:818 length:624 start_codon:yes stop_codon:yes gene_type:complete
MVATDNCKKYFIIIFYSIIILLSFNLRSLSNADEISDYEIEGITLYDSALKHYSINELKKDVINNYTSDKYSTSAIWQDLIEYDYLQLSFKSDDTKYIIQDISGTKNMTYNKCLNKLGQIENEISSLYENNSNIKNEGKVSYNHPADKSGNSKVTDVAWVFKNGDLIVIQCYNWQTEYGKKNNFRDSLKIAISNKDIDRWFSYEAYN